MPNQELVDRLHTRVSDEEDGTWRTVTTYRGREYTHFVFKNTLPQELCEVRAEARNYVLNHPEQWDGWLDYDDDDDYYEEEEVYFDADHDDNSWA